MGDAFLVFSVEGRRFALPVSQVERVVAAVETTPLLDMPSSVRGAVNVGGEGAPVLDMRPRMGFPPRDMELSDRFLLFRRAGKLFALMVDGVEGVLFSEAGDLFLPSSSGESGGTPSASVMLDAAKEDIILIQSGEALLSFGAFGVFAESSRG